jgi:hypothetical protein
MVELGWMAIVGTGVAFGAVQAEAQLDAVCEQASQRQMDYKTFLVQALETEWQGRYQRGIEARLRQARFPWLKALEQFDFDFQPSLDRRQVRSEEDRRFIEENRGSLPLLGYLSFQPAAIQADQNGASICDAVPQLAREAGEIVDALESMVP